jgi:adenosine deaminase
MRRRRQIESRLRPDYAAACQKGSSSVQGDVVTDGEFEALPKVELHLHLDCSLSYALVHRLDPSITLETFRRDFVAPSKCRSLADFLTRPPRQIALMQTRERLRAATQDVFDQLKRDSVLYAELRFAPLLHTQAGLTPEEVTATVDEAVEEGVASTGIEAGLILCTLRHFSSEQSLLTAELAVRHARTPGSRVVGLDLAGDEAGFPLAPHVLAFGFAARSGVACTAHAGEAAGPESVRETLLHLRPSRIGHGVRSVEDPLLVRRLAGERIHLEVCPSSNVQTNICDTFADHPIDQLARAGVSLGVSTDCRTVTDITLSGEYRRLAGSFGWRHADFLRRNLDALQAAFIRNPSVRETLEARLHAAYVPGV